MDNSSTLPLLRLIQVTDSSFPVGGYAYSHGLEWLVHERQVTTGADLRSLLTVFLSQTLRRQWMPACSAAFRARSAVQLRRVDQALDASIVAVAERSAGRAMGRRLVEVAMTASLPAPPALLEDVRAGTTPGQFGVAFGALAAGAGATEPVTLAALGYSLVNSVTQAAVRLGVIGADAAARLVAETLAPIAAAAAAVSARPRQTIGSFAPGLELAAMLQPTLRFRMFAS